MNRNLVLATALGAGLMTVAGLAQAPAAASQPMSAAPAAAPVKPEAIPAKIALVAFEEAVFATNEGQKTVEDIQKKYEPKRTAIETSAKEVDVLKKQLQGAPATLSDADRAAKLKAIDAREKQLNRDAEEASTSYNAELQEAFGKLAPKVNAVMKTYLTQNGYTLAFDVSNQQQSTVVFALPNTIITQALVEAYNTASGVPAPVPAAPSATRPAAPASSTTPKK
jgi:Skp family chaperone for outer membrane proteins